MIKRLAIVPARGGSKRLLEKNIRDFCGQPMIAHTLLAACKSNLFDVIHVSTEDSKIIEVATGLGFAPEFPRPDDLADDQTPLMPVLKYVTERFLQMGKEFDEVWLLMACAPLVEDLDLIAAAQLFKENGGANAVMSVAPYPAPVEWAYSRDEKGALTPRQPGMFALRSQDLEASYYDSGSFAVFPANQILASEGAGSDAGFIGYVLPRDKAVDIDTEEDWMLAEAIFRGRSSSGGE